MNSCGYAGAAHLAPILKTLTKLRQLQCRFLVLVFLLYFSHMFSCSGLLCGGLTNCCSGNSFGATGWAAIMSGLEQCWWVETVKGVPWRELCMGSIQKLNLQEQHGDLDGDDSGLALACLPYLRRSASCLTSLNLRCWLSLLPMLILKPWLSVHLSFMWLDS